MLAEGLSKKEIAGKLDISATTVVTYIERMYEKLNVTNAPAAVDKAHRFGLFQPNRE
jgi:ATP/maltotriose-dependent transcriptional regulator MalT